MAQKIKEKLEEAYNHSLPYIEEYQILNSMCKRCERFVEKNTIIQSVGMSHALNVFSHTLI